MSRKPEEAMRSLDSAIEETERAIDESQHAIQGLRSEAMAKGKLAELLRSTSRELANTGRPDQEPPAVEVIEEGNRQALASNTRNDVCRIAVEILRNAYRHAQAHRIEAEIRYDDRMLRLRIRDDGKGIDAKVLKEGGRAGHWGLGGMRERAKSIGAQLDIWSEPGLGTEVQLSVPAAVAYETTRKDVGSKWLRKVRTLGQRS